MEVNAENLRQRYNKMEIDELMKLRAEGSLSKIASDILDEALKEKGVSDEMHAEIIKKLGETAPPSSNKRAPQNFSGPLKTKWLKVWNYLFLPFFGIINIHLAMTKLKVPFSIGAAIVAILYLSTSFGLYHRKLWAWKLNWITLFLPYFIVIVTVVARVAHLKKITGGGTKVNQMGLEAFFMALSLALIWLWPNYVYWRKRRERFF